MLQKNVLAMNRAKMHLKNSKRYVKTTKQRIAYFINGKFRSIEQEPIFVLGNQKSGTSAIAALLGERIGLSYSIDLRNEITNPVFHEVFCGNVSLSELIRKNRLDFTRKIIKEPNLSFLLKELRYRFPKATFVIVIRDPKDNIRSLLDRHDLKGKIKNLTEVQLSNISDAWQAILFNRGLPICSCEDELIAQMAVRWREIANIWIENQDQMTLITYEDFKADKQRAIDHLASRLKYDCVVDISSKLDQNFQKPGKPVADYLDFFGETNLEAIKTICSKEMKLLGYEVKE